MTHDGSGEEDGSKEPPGIKYPQIDSLQYDKEYSREILLPPPWFKEKGISYWSIFLRQSCSYNASQPRLLVLR